MTDCLSPRHWIRMTSIRTPSPRPERTPITAAFIPRWWERSLFSNPSLLLAGVNRLDQCGYGEPFRSANDSAGKTCTARCAHPFSDRAVYYWSRIRFAIARQMQFATCQRRLFEPVHCCGDRASCGRDGAAGLAVRSRWQKAQGAFAFTFDRSFVRRAAGSCVLVDALAIEQSRTGASCSAFIQRCLERLSAY